MLEITQAAGEHLKIILQEARPTADLVIRVLRRDRGYLLHFDKVCSDDETFCYEGSPVLVIDNAAAQLLMHRVLDVKATPGGLRLSLT